MPIVAAEIKAEIMLGVGYMLSSYHGRGKGSEPLVIVSPLECQMSMLIILGGDYQKSHFLPEIDSSRY